MVYAGEVTQGQVFCISWPWEIQELLQLPRLGDPGAPRLELGHVTPGYRLGW